MAKKTPVHDRIPSPWFKCQKTCCLCIKDLKSSISGCKLKHARISITEISGETVIHLTNKVEFQATSYCIGMMFVYGSTGGLPDIAETQQIIIVCESLVFVVKLQSAWFCERFRCLKLESTSIVKVIKLWQLTDLYPLATYSMEGNQMGSLKVGKL